MFGKSVRFRRCPATVSGDEGPSCHCASGKAGPSENPKPGDRPDDLAVCLPRGWWHWEPRSRCPILLAKDRVSLLRSPPVAAPADGRRHTTRVAMLRKYIFLFVLTIAIAAAVSRWLSPAIRPGVAADQRKRHRLPASSERNRQRRQNRRGAHRRPASDLQRPAHRPRASASCRA